MLRHFIIMAKPSIISVGLSHNFIAGPKDLPNSGINSLANSGIWLSTKTKLGYKCWIPAFAGMTECRDPTVLPAKAGIQCRDYFHLTWAFWITRFRYKVFKPFLFLL